MPTNRQITIFILLVTALSFAIFGNLVTQNSRLEAALELDLKDAVSLVQRNAKFVKAGLRGQNRSLHLVEARADSTKIIANTDHDQKAMASTEDGDAGAHKQSEKRSWLFDRVEQPCSQLTNVTAQEAAEHAKKSFPFEGARILIQLLFGVLYYAMIVARYPKMYTLDTPLEDVMAYRRRGVIGGLCYTSCPILCYSCLCPGPRGAHTMSSTGTLNYCCGLIVMSIFPCLTLCLTMTCTDMEVRLGGRKRNFIQSCLCALCCQCCVLSQDAQSLDLITGTESLICGIRLPRTEKPEPTRTFAPGPGPAYQAAPYSAYRAPVSGTTRPITREELMRSGRFESVERPMPTQVL